MGNGNVERAELHKTIWCIAKDLRGSVDGWDFKAYVPHLRQLLRLSNAVELPKPRL